MVDMQALADKLQSEVLDVERRQALRLTRRYAATYRRLKTSLRAAMDAVAAQEQQMTADEAMNLPAFQAFMDSTIAEMNAFGADAYQEIVSGLGEAVDMGLRHAETMMLAPVADADREKAEGKLEMPQANELLKGAGLA